MRQYSLSHWLVLLAIIVLLFYGKQIAELVDRFLDALRGRPPRGVFKS
jgi:Sec-independent protein translocase protein TatA